jgi:hypothetical protein
MAGKEDKKLWTTHRITWEFPGKLCGSVPKNPEMVESWLNARRPGTVPPSARSITEIQSEVAASMVNDETTSNEDLEKRSWLGFQAPDGGLVMRGSTVRAHFKDCARIVNAMFIGKLEKEKSLGWKVTNGLYVEEYWVPIVRYGIKVQVPDGSMDKAVHTMTRSGPINALKRIDFVSNVSLTFTLRLLCGLQMKDIETIMEYGAIHGYAGERSDGEGRYIFEQVGVEA